MSEARLYTVPPHQFLRDLSRERVFFHGVNKSGSTAMASVLLQAYQANGRASSFMCRYFGNPPDSETAIARLRERSADHAILLDHNLVGIRSLFRDAAYITLLRDPVRRIISCYYWLRTHHPEELGGRELKQWVAHGGRAYTTIFQFACYESPGVDTKKHIMTLSPERMYEMGRAWFSYNMDSFGITELFEESAMLFASQLGLSSIPAWNADKRNKQRPRWELVDEGIKQYIADLISYDVEFYKERRREFEILIREWGQADRLKAYRDACLNARHEQEAYGADTAV